MTLTDASYSQVEGEGFAREFTELGSARVLARVAELSDAAYADYLELLNEYRSCDSDQEKREILSALLEIVLDGPVKTIPAEQIEREARGSLEGSAAAERFQRQAQAFGANLRRIRGERGMNQSDLAKAANMTQPQISYLERGEHRPQETTVARLARALGVDPEELLPLG